MATENTHLRRPSGGKTATENTTAPGGRRRGRAAIALSAPYIEVLDGYAAALRSSPLSEQTRRTYASKVRQFLAWLAAADLHEDLLTSTDGRDWAVRDYRTHLQGVLKRSPATVNNALAAVDDFYIRRGLGPASAARVQITAAAPRALDERAQLRYLREVQRCPSPRDQAVALVPFYAGARISEIVALDVDDIARSARKGVLRILGKGERVRHVPIHPQLRTALAGWLDERDDWPGADSTALFLNQRGQRLSVRGVHDIVTAIAAAAGLEDHATVHVYADVSVMPMLVGGAGVLPAQERCRTWEIGIIAIPKVGPRGRRGRVAWRLAPTRARPGAISAGDRCTDRSCSRWRALD